MNIRVYIGTTKGPVIIERITREKAPRSAMCVRKTTQETFVSPGYDAFVRQPSGVIERALGPYSPGGFRLDVSDEINTGDSWQLGVFMAHLLARKKWLAEIDSATRKFEAVWLTGEVTNDLEVRPVSHVNEKIKASQKEFQKLSESGISLKIFMHPKNLAQINKAELPSRTQIIPVTSAKPWVKDLNILGDVLKIPDRQQNFSVFSFIGITCLIAVISVGFWFEGYVNQTKTLVKPQKAQTLVNKTKIDTIETKKQKPQQIVFQKKIGKTSISLFEQRAPIGYNCLAVNFGNIKASTTKVEITKGRYFATSEGKGLCALKFLVEIKKPAIFFAAFTQKVSGQFVRWPITPKELNGHSLVSGTYSWKIEFSESRDKTAQYLMVFLQSHSSLAGEIKRLKTLENFDSVLNGLQNKGIRVEMTSHKINS